jgi:hypothetical protein
MSSDSGSSSFGEEDEPEWEVERILAEREHQGQKVFLVKWLNFDDNECTWEPAENFMTEVTLIEWKKQLATGDTLNDDEIAHVEERMAAFQRAREERERQENENAEQQREARRTVKRGHDATTSSPNGSKHRRQSPTSAQFSTKKGIAHIIRPDHTKTLIQSPSRPQPEKNSLKTQVPSPFQSPPSPPALEALPTESSPPLNPKSKLTASRSKKAPTKIAVASQRPVLPQRPMAAATDNSTHKDAPPKTTPTKAPSKIALSLASKPGGDVSPKIAHFPVSTVSAISSTASSTSKQYYQPNYKTGERFKKLAHQNENEQRQDPQRDSPLYVPEESEVNSAVSDTTPTATTEPSRTEEQRAQVDDTEDLVGRIDILVPHPGKNSIPTSKIINDAPKSAAQGQIFNQSIPGERQAHSNNDANTTNLPRQNVTIERIVASPSKSSVSPPYRRSSIESADKPSRPFTDPRPALTSQPSARRSSMFQQERQSHDFFVRGDRSYRSDAPPSNEIRRDNNGRTWQRGEILVDLYFAGHPVGDCKFVHLPSWAVGKFVRVKQRDMKSLQINFEQRNMKTVEEFAMLRPHVSHTTLIHPIILIDSLDSRQSRRTRSNSSLC